MSTNTTTRKLNGNTTLGSSKQHHTTHQPQQQPQQQQHHHHHQTTTSSHHLHQQHATHHASSKPAASGPSAAASHQHQPLHTVPPRYQPPPHPPTTASGGILKNIPHTTSSGGHSARNVPPPPPPPQHHYPEHAATPHLLPLNIKYPPDVPKLTTVYIPDGVARSANGTATSSLSKGGIHSTALPPAQRQHQPLHHQRHSTGVPSSSAVASLPHQLPGLLQRHPTAIGADELRASLQHHQQQVLHHHHLLGQHHQQTHQLQQQEMLKFVRKPEAEQTSSSGQAAGGASSGSAVAAAASSAGPGAVNGGAASNSNGQHINGVGLHNGGGGSGSSARISAEQNRQLQQSMLAELRSLKEANQRLSDDNQELRDLCCFLDDDRQKGRKLAREWQRFGRYTASVMRQEVSAYQNKLRQLDDKQQELIRDNLELKELCLYMDEERTNVAANMASCGHCGATVRPPLRDDGDGSSSSTNADEPMPTIRQFERPIPELNIRPTLSDQTLQYVRSLERKIRQLELQADAGAQNGNGDPLSNGRPEAVVRALQILEVREQIERDRTTAVGGAGGNGNGVSNGASNGNGAGGMTDGSGDGSGEVNGSAGGGALSTEHMDDGEKALVREMCNVVWRKLEDSPNGTGLE